MFTPSGDVDTFNFLAGTSTIVGTTVSQNIVYQAGLTFDTGDYTFTLTEDITFNGITKTVTFTGTDSIGDVYNFYSINEQLVRFGDFSLLFHGATFTATDLSEQPRTLDADVIETPVPEPSSLILLGTGSLAMLSAARSRFRKV